MRESEIERKVSRFARKQGWLVYKWSSPNYRGVPDRIYVRSGAIKIIEFKAPGKRPTRLQEEVISDLRANGMEVHVIDGIESGKRIFEE